MLDNAARIIPEAACDPGSETASENAPVRPILRRLFQTLEARGVRYCHWKSNIRLADALSGVDDVDLLVDREHAATFQNAILEAGFKFAVSRSSKGHPGVFHAFALDEESLELIHLHAYFQVVSGDSLVKSYRFNVEHRLLDRTRFLQGVRTPTPEAELVLLTLRLALKYVNLVEILMARRDAHTSRNEVIWLLKSCDLNAAVALGVDWFPEMEPELFLRLISAFQDSRQSAWSLSRLGKSVASRLKDRRRVGRTRAALSRAYRVATQVFNRLSHRRDLVLQTSGVIVAVIGPKATGKSTLSAEIARRLSPCLDVMHIHAGKPPATALTAAPRLLLPLARKLFPKERPGEYDRAERRIEGRFSALYCLRMLMLAHDRRMLLRKALRRSTAGTIVVSDRYPSMKAGLSDSSCFSDAVMEQEDLGMEALDDASRAASLHNHARSRVGDPPHCAHRDNNSSGRAAG